jgi:hypothetical protein
MDARTGIESLDRPPLPARESVSAKSCFAHPAASISYQRRLLHLSRHSHLSSAHSSQHIYLPDSRQRNASALIRRATPHIILISAHQHQTQPPLSHASAALVLCS